MCGPNLTSERKIAKERAEKGGHQLGKFKWEFKPYTGPRDPQLPWVIGTAICTKCGQTIIVKSDSYRTKLKNVRTEGLDIPCIPA
jgi:hypothetical protein